MRIIVLLIPSSLQILVVAADSCVAAACPKSTKTAETANWLRRKKWAQANESIPPLKSTTALRGTPWQSCTM
jgi:hypothetical protein